MTNEQNNLDDSFETRHFDEGRPRSEPPCKSLVQRSRILIYIYILSFDMTILIYFLFLLL